MLDIQKKLSNLFYSLLSLPATAMGFALCVQISALSWIMRTQYHLSIEEVGWVWLSGPLAGIIGQLLVGVISDQVWFLNGRRRPFILIGGTIAALMLLCLPNLDKISASLGITNMMITALFVALTLDLAINISFNPTRSLIADVTPEGEARTKGYTWMQTISGFFGVAAYFIGAQWGNYTLIYIGVAVVLLLSVVPTFFITEPRHLTPNITPDKPAAKTRTTQTDELWKIYLAHGFTWLGVQTMFVFIFAFIEQKMNLPNPDDIGKVISYSFLIMNTVGFLLPLWVLTPITQKIGRVRTHTICVALMAVAYLGIVIMGHTPGTLYILMLLVGIGWGAVVSIPFAIFTDKINQEKMGLYMGIFNLSVVIPQVIVSGIFGKIIGLSADKNIVFIISCIALTLSTLLWVSVKEALPIGKTPPNN